MEIGDEMKHWNYRTTNFFTLMLFIITAVFFAGCGLLPGEEEFRSVPVFTEDETEDFIYTSVKRGDLYTSVSVTAQYEPAAEETYSFSISNLSYGTVYVEIGDTVQKGDLLAELDMGSIDEDIYDCDLNLITAYAEQDYLNKMIEIAYRRCILNGMDEEKAKETAKEEYHLELEKNQLTINLLEEMKSELENQRENRRIYSKIDGVVSYLLEVNEDDRSRRGSDFITIVDPTMTFTSLTNKWMYYVEGEEVTLEIKGKAYSGTITSIMDEGKSNIGQMKIQMVLNTSVAGLKQGDRAEAIVQTGSRYNVLYLPKKAVTKAGGSQIVYVEKDGIKTIQKIRTGFVGDDNIEITNGLEENALIVLR